MPSRRFFLLKNPSSWRRLSIADWRSPNDPTVYGSLKIDFTAAADYLEHINQTSPDKVTATHLVSKAMAVTLQKYPDLNGIIRFKRIYLRKSIDIFLQVAVDAVSDAEKPDLSGAKIENCDQKTLAQIAAELKHKCQMIRKKQDAQFKNMKGLLDWIPMFLLTGLLRFLTFVMYDLGISLKILGVPEDAFGSAMVTSVGMFRVPSGFAPLVPMSRVPLIICVGEVREKPWAVEGEVVVKPILDVSVTFDHRFMDGLTGARMAHYFQEVIQNPERYL